MKIHAKNHSSYTLFTLISLIIPIVGIILGIVYLSKQDEMDRKLGEHSIAMSILGFILSSLLLTLI